MSKKDMKLSLETEESPLLAWVENNGLNLLYGLLTLLLLIFLLYRFLSGSSVQNEKDYFEAENLKDKLNSSALTVESADKLGLILTKHPELTPKYEGVLAQAYLNLMQPEKAQTYLRKNEERIKGEESPFNASNSQIAILMGEGKWQNALDQSLELKTVCEEAGTLPILYLYNYVRLISLSEKLGLKGDEKRWIQEFTALSKKGAKGGVTPLIFDQFIKTVDFPDISFLSFIKAREKLLN